MSEEHRDTMAERDMGQLLDTLERIADAVEAIQGALVRADGSVPANDAAETTERVRL